MFTPTQEVTPTRRLARISELLTRDYCRSYDRYLTWLRKPLSVLLMALLTSTLCGLYLHHQGFVLAFAIAAVVIAGGAWPWMNLAGIQGSVGFDRKRGVEGDPLVARISVRNRLPWGSWGLSIRVGLEGDDAGDVGLACAAGWRTTEASWRFTPSCRGEYAWAEPKITTSFPFGLWTARRCLEFDDPLLIWPRTFPVGPIPDLAFGQGTSGPSQCDRSGTSGDVLGLRSYRRGDPLRLVHWPQAARHGRLIVRELQAEAFPRVQVVLDVDPTVHSGLGPQGSREWAIRIAASFLSGWSHQGADVQAVFGEAAIVPHDLSVAARRAQFLDSLSRITLAGSQRSLSELLGFPVCHDFTGFRLVVTTDIGCERLGTPRFSGVTERFVVLETAAFGESKAFSSSSISSTPQPIRPWILVNDFRRVPEIVGRASNGGSHV